MPYKDPEQQKAAQQEWYQKHKEKVKRESREKRIRNYSWLCEQKAQPCADCQLSWPPYVMDFHHRDELEKLDAVGQLIQKASRQRVIDEIAKCDLLYANCHRIRTYNRT